MRETGLYRPVFWVDEWICGRLDLWTVGFGLGEWNLMDVKKIYYLRAMGLMWLIS